jgi:sulfite reductase (NADPH) flavoprotein alpha-component
MAGSPASASAPAPRLPPVSIDRAHAAFLAAAPDALRWNVALPSDPAAPLEWRYFTARAPHPRAADTLRIDPRTLEVIARQPYAELPRGRRLIASLLPLHTGAWFGEAGRVAMMLASFAMPLFAVTGWWLWLQRRRRAALARDAAAPAVLPGGAAVEILHASQSGTAERVAHLTAGWLRAIGLAPQVRALAHWQPAHAGEAPALFVVASYGEGDPPDAALGFARRWLRATPPDLSRLHCGVLALGNRRYATFCGFGHALAGWLARGGARSWSPLVESHEAEPASLQAWRARLAERWPALAHAPGADDAQAAAPAFETWTLQRRRWLNPRSPGAALCELWLTPPPGPAPHWQPGDLLEFAGADGVARPYSIASLPGADGVRLLVRRCDGAEGPGEVSAPLCDLEAPLGPRAARLRRAVAFDPPPADVPAILIANGVGVAPFLALLARADRAPRWLLFGERDPRDDAALLPELEAALADGRLARLDLAWSRATPPAYVQQRLREAAAELRGWLARGAALRVCGSPQMGAAVDALLEDLLGADTLQAWLDAGRYRRELF